MQKFPVNISINSYSDITRRIQLVGTFQNHIAELAQQGLSIFVRPADLVIVGVVQQQAGDVEDRLVSGNPPSLQVSIVILLQYLIQLESRAVSVVGSAGHIEPAYPLAGFAHGFRRTIQNIAVYLGHLPQVLLQNRMAFHLGHPLTFRYRPRDPVLNSPDHQFLRVVKFRVLRMLFPVKRKLFQQAAPA